MNQVSERVVAAKPGHAVELTTGKPPRNIDLEGKQCNAYHCTPIKLEVFAA